MIISKRRMKLKHFLQIDDVSDPLSESLAIVFYLCSRIRFLFLSRGSIPDVEISFE